MKRIPRLFSALAMLLVLLLFGSCADHSAPNPPASPDGASPSVSSGTALDIADTASKDSNDAASDSTGTSGASSGAYALPSGAIPEADRVYIPFLKELQTKENAPELFCFKDIDGDGVDELLTHRNTAVTFYTYTDRVIEIEDHDFHTGTLRLLNSGDPVYPGIVYFSVGGGHDWYHYLTIKDGKLSSETLWTDNYGYAEEGESGRVTEISSDKRLIELSRAAYKKNQDIEFYPIDAVK